MPRASCAQLREVSVDRMTTRVVASASNDDVARTRSATYDNGVALARIAYANGRAGELADEGV